MNINKRLQALSLRSCTSTEFAFMKAVEEMGERVEWMGCSWQEYYEYEATTWGLPR